MAYLQNKKFLEIREAAKNGNEKALQILQAMRKGNPQEDVDRMVGDYYAIPVEPVETVENDVVEETPAVEGIEEIPVETPEIPDLTEILDGELDGIISENEIEELSFKDFLGNKRKDFNRSKKNTDYFKAFDQGGREKYLNDKTSAYKSKFDVNIADIDRYHGDINKAISAYSNNVNEMLDDGIEFDSDVATKAYDDFTNDDVAMHSFGRHWDDMDNEVVVNSLKNLVAQYGKKNVQAALNVLNGDNDNYKAFKNNKINTEIERYQKDLEKLLK